MGSGDGDGAAASRSEDGNEIKMEAMGRTEAQDERIMRSLLDFEKGSFCHLMEVTEFFCLLSKKKKRKKGRKEKETKRK